MIEDKEWQDKTDKTLKRIESQDDSSNIQEGFARSFREAVLVKLARIEALLKTESEKHEMFMEESRDDREKMHMCIDKIPIMENGLNNHLHAHDTFRKYIMYPVTVIMVGAMLGIFAKVVLHVF